MAWAYGHSLLGWWISRNMVVHWGSLSMGYLKSDGSSLLMETTMEKLLGSLDEWYMNGLSLIQFLWQFPWEVFHLKIRLPPLGNQVKLNFDGSFNLCTQYVDIGGSMSGLAGTHIVTFTGKFAADHSLGDKLHSLLKGIENMDMASTMWS